MFRQIKKWDVTIGKKIFHPIVIKLCHILKCNQYRLSRDMWFVTFMTIAVYEVFLKEQPLSWWKLPFLGLLFLSIVIGKDAKSADSLILRLMIWLFVIMDVIFTAELYLSGSPLMTHFIIDLLTNLSLLTAEYAKTIDTIPPDKKKEKKTKKVYRESFVG